MTDLFGRGISVIVGDGLVSPLAAEIWSCAKVVLP
jgi:hypothetical protein